jgi:hypothetical protein
MRNRVLRLESSFNLNGGGCGGHLAKVINSLDERPMCEICGQPLPIVFVPTKLSEDEWRAKAAS